MKKKQEAKPTTRMIDQLFKELLGWDRERQHPLYPEFKKLDDELDSMEERFKASAKYRSFKKRRDTAHDRFWASFQSQQNKVRDVLRRYRAHGLTNAIHREIKNLVEELKSS